MPQTETGEPLVFSATMLPPELNLIVAATHQMGIGRGGGLPWTGLKKEMAYFSRVTRRTNTAEQVSTACDLVIMA